LRIAVPPVGRLKIWDGGFSDRIYRIYRNSRFRLPPPAEKVGQAPKGGGIGVQPDGRLRYVFGDFSDRIYRIYRNIGLSLYA